MVALALAAPLFFTAPALADAGHKQAKKGKRVVSNVTLAGPAGTYTVSSHARGYDRPYGHNYRVNVYGQSTREAERLERQAVRACRRAIRQEAYQIGFRDVDFERSRRVKQIGPLGFRVTFREVEFEGRRRDWERRVSCVVRRGDLVRQIKGIPEPRRRGKAYQRSYAY